MKIVGVAACTAGIAHTFLAKEKLVKAAQEAGHEVKIETQGT
ncbi:PTS fructose transporter subunit IIB, partial [Virgibacillus sp. 7505]